MKKEMIEKLSASLLEMIKETEGRWKIPFSPFVQINAKTKKPYKGFNQLITSIAEMPDNRWIGFKQCEELGGKVKKGSKSTPIIKYVPIADETEEEAEKRKGGFCVNASIFNVSQTDLVEKGVLPPFEGWNKAQIVSPNVVPYTVERLQVEMKESLTASAYYSPSGDFIHMPKLALFSSEGEYISTFAHELGHWTGAESRMNRVFGKSFGDTAYALEELVAETFALLFCREFAVDYRRDEEVHVVDNSVLYLKHWLKTLRNDPSHIVTACSKAYNAFEYVSERLGWVQAEAPPVKENKPKVKVKDKPKPKPEPKCQEELIYENAPKIAKHPKWVLRPDQEKVLQKWMKTIPKGTAVKVEEVAEGLKYTANLKGEPAVVFTNPLPREAAEEEQFYEDGIPNPYIPYPEAMQKTLKEYGVRYSTGRHPGPESIYDIGDFYYVDHRYIWKKTPQAVAMVEFFKWEQTGKLNERDAGLINNVAYNLLNSTCHYSEDLLTELQKVGLSEYTDEESFSFAPSWTNEKGELEWTAKPMYHGATGLARMRKIAKKANKAYLLVYDDFVHMGYAYVKKGELVADLLANTHTRVEQKEMAKAS